MMELRSTTTSASGTPDGAEGGTLRCGKNTAEIQERTFPRVGAESTNDAALLPETTPTGTA